MLTEETKKKIIEVLQQETSPEFIILFGSQAKGCAREDSDIDLAFFSGKQLSSYERFNLANQLAIICGTDVDLVDIKEIDTVFAMQVFENGIPIFVSNENEFTRQKIKAYRMYAVLNEQRAVVIEGIKKRGSVYGNE